MALQNRPFRDPGRKPEIISSQTGKISITHKKKLETKPAEEVPVQRPAPSSPLRTSAL